MGGYWKDNKYINTCDWCGKECGPGQQYCSEKRKREAYESRHPRKESRKIDSSSYESESTGFFGLIWKVVKWVIIITIIWFVYDNYLK